MQEIARARKKSREHVTLPESAREWLGQYYADDARRLREIMPDLDLTLWRSIPPLD